MRLWFVCDRNLLFKRPSSEQSASQCGAKNKVVNTAIHQTVTKSIWQKRDLLILPPTNTSDLLLLCSASVSTKHFTATYDVWKAQIQTFAWFTGNLQKYSLAKSAHVPGNLFTALLWHYFCHTLHIFRLSAATQHHQTYIQLRHDQDVAV